MPDVCAVCRVREVPPTRSVCEVCVPGSPQSPPSTYREWEVRLGLALADADKALDRADYLRLLNWLSNVCDGEREVLRG